MADRVKHQRSTSPGGSPPTVVELMQRPAFRIRSDMRVGVTWALFIERALAMAPVVDGRGRPVGTLWRGDLAAAVLDDEPTQPGAGAGRPDDDRQWPFRRAPAVSELSLVGDVMRAGVATIASSASLEEARNILQECGAAELVVVDRAGGMLGVLAARDLLAGDQAPQAGAPVSITELGALAGRGHAPRR